MSELSGSKGLRKALREIDPATGNRVALAMARGAEEIEQKIVGGAPRDEGDLISSIAKKKGRDGLTWVIGPGAKSIAISKNPFAEAPKGIPSPTKSFRFLQFFKAYWYEFGTKKQPARPFIQPAFDTSRDRILRQVRAAVNQALEEQWGRRLR
jgi:HK97 gp10 family phage protein